MVRMPKDKESDIDASRIMHFDENIPDPIPVRMPAACTALLVLDSTETARSRKSFVESIPTIRKLIQKSRAAGVKVIYTITMKLGPNIVEEIKPDESSDYLLETYGADKFYKTNLEEILFRHRIRNLVLVGTAANGAVLYTAFEAILRGFTVVVAADCVSADNENVYRFTLWQVLNSPGRTNPLNKPLAPFATTLTTEKDITFF